MKAGWKIYMLIIILCMTLSGCGYIQKQDQGTPYTVYYVNHDETGLYTKEYRSLTEDKEILLTEMLTQLSTISEKLEYKVPFGNTCQLLDFTLTGDQLTLSFDEHYREQSVTTEILIRAAIVRTLTQIDGISFVSFMIRSEPLSDAYGNVVGVMTADTFIDNAGNEISSYEKVKLKLYFTDETGTKLSPVSRTVVYNSNIPLERLVVEQMIAGPDAEDKALPTINPDTRIVTVNVKDGTCYVNLDATFLTQAGSATSEVTIYSLTNSLVELANINKVQISINGDTNVNYRDNINFSTFFERNLELIQ